MTEAPARDRARRRAASPHGWEHAVTVWSGRVVLIAAVWCLLAIPLDYVTPTLVRGISTVFGLVNIPVAANVFTGVMLAVVGSALMVRKRAALWFVAIGFQAGWLLVAALVTVLKTWRFVHVPEVLLDSRPEIVIFWVEVATAFVLLGVLWRVRDHFSARLAPGAFRAALTNLAVGLAVSAAVGVVLTQIVPGTLHGVRREVMWPVRTAVGLMPEPDSPFYAGSPPDWVAAVIGALSTIALLRAGQVLLRSWSLNRRLDPDDELRVRRLLEHFGDGDSLGYFATRRDKAVLFAPNGQAAVTYRVEAGVSLASADPIGDAASWDAAIARWLDEAREFGWSPAALSASERGAAAYRRAGLRVLSLGDEAVIDVARFRMGAPQMRPVRHAVSRVERAGYELDVRLHGDIPAGEMDELAACAERWRGDEPERGFSMTLGRLGDAADRRCVMVTARDRDGSVRALLSFVPWGHRGLSLDLMRRDPSADNGVVEFMVCGLAQAARSLGIGSISLNFAMFRELFAASERLGAGPVVRATSKVLSAASRWWQLETLYRSNVKYLPRWAPRYLCFADTLQLNRALVAAGIAEGHLPRLRPASADGAQAPATAELAAAVDALSAEPRPDGRGQLPPAVRARHRKVEVLAASGISAYPPRVVRTGSIAQLRRRHADLPAASGSGEQVSIVGRVVRIRNLGRLCFADLREGGAEIQVMLTKDRTGSDLLDRWRDTVDIGDHVGCSGELVATRTGELTVDVVAWSMAAKCLHQVPDAREAPLTDDQRARDRHLDLIVNPEAVAIVRDRAAVLARLRGALAERGFVEVETPMLHRQGGDPSAFTAYSDAYEAELWLREAPERFLKRLCVGGIDRLYELSRSFHDLRAGAAQLPEHTGLELYQAHADHREMRALGRELVLAAADALPAATDGRACRVPGLDGDWPVVDVHEALDRIVGSATRELGTDDLRALCGAHGLVVPYRATPGELVVALYGELVVPATAAPTVYTGFAVDAAPLARAVIDDPRVADRSELVAGGLRLGVAQSELTDPVVQRQRLVARLRRSSDDRGPGALDEEFLQALEFAMPPTGGLRLAVDRLLMLLTGATIDSTVAFPFAAVPGSVPVGRVEAD